MINKFVICVLAMVILSGCATRSNYITHRLESASNASQTYLHENFTLVSQGAEVTLYRHFVLFMPLSDSYTYTYSSLDEATIVDEMLDKYQGDLVTNITIESKFLFLLYYNLYYVVSKGDVWKRKVRS